MKKLMKTGGFAAVASVAAFVGCSSIPSVGPDYESPEIAVPVTAMPDAGLATSNLTATAEYEAAKGDADTRVVISDDVVARWWTRFQDPVLEQIVEAGVSNNVSYNVAIRRLAEAEWQLLGSYSDFLPKFGVNGGWTHNVKRNNNIGYYDSNTHSYRTEGFDLGMKGTWEIDIFGGSRRNTEAAIAAAQAAGWTVDDAWVALTTQIGKNYISLRTVQERLQVSRTNLKLQTETYDILKSRLDSGIGDELAVNQCAYIVEQTRATIPSLLAQEEQLKNALAILAGTMPGSLHELLKPVEKEREWLLPPQKVAELPINMLRSRPDVRRAERELAAQTARIGVAKAQWFPKLFLTGQVGLESKHLEKLCDPMSILSSFGPAISWPIFQGGAIYANVKAEQERTEAAVLQYRGVVQDALADIRDNYAAYTQEYHRYRSLKAAVKAATDAVTISQDLYKNGLRDFNNVLDAQRSRLQFEEQMVISRGLISSDLISLYKSLGGGLAISSAR